MKKVIFILTFLLVFTNIHGQDKSSSKDSKQVYYYVSRSYTDQDTIKIDVLQRFDSAKVSRRTIIDSLARRIYDSIQNRYPGFDSLKKNEKLQPIGVLIKKKNETIKELEEDLSASQILTYSLIAIAGIALILLIVQYRRRKQLKKRFDELIKRNKEADSLEKEKPQIKEELDIPQNVRDKIIVGLENFENNYHFIDSDMKLSSLAVMLDTNSNYLSKIINHHKRMNFSSYINDLRINYTLKLLDKDQKIRRYSIKGIAQEVGYNSAESFSNAFYKKTGLKPSYYIKQLGKLDA